LSGSVDWGWTLDAKVATLDGAIEWGWTPEGKLGVGFALDGAIEWGWTLEAGAIESMVGAIQWGWDLAGTSTVTVPGPYCLAAAGWHAPGAVIADTHSPGLVAGQACCE
jgi:hypothetical protein